MHTIFLQGTISRSSQSSLTPTWAILTVSQTLTMLLIAQKPHAEDETSSRDSGVLLIV